MLRHGTAHVQAGPLIASVVGFTIVVFASGFEGFQSLLPGPLCRRRGIPNQLLVDIRKVLDDQLDATLLVRT